MLSKWKLEMLGILASLSLVSVGFSTWNISAAIPIYNTVQGNLQADYVIKTDEYVYFDKDGNTATDDGIVLPYYNEDGFITKNSSNIYEISEKGYIYLYFTINGSVCNSENSALSKNEDKYLQIACDITLDKEQIAFFSNVGFFASSDDKDLDEGNITHKPIKSSEGKTVGYTVYFGNYDFTKLKPSNIGETTISPYATIEIKISLSATDKTLLSKHLDNTRFIFNTEVYVTKEQIDYKSIGNS